MASVALKLKVVNIYGRRTTLEHEWADSTGGTPWPQYCIALFDVDRTYRLSR